MVQSYMEAIGLRVHDVVLFFDLVVNSSDPNASVCIDRFVEGCMSMKGMATSMDMQRQLIATRATNETLSRFEKSCKQRLDQLALTTKATARRLVVLESNRPAGTDVDASS